MNEDDEKELYIDALCGIGFPCFTTADQMAKAGFARFTGNQHNLEWVWERSSLRELKVSTVKGLYEITKERKPFG